MNQEPVCRTLGFGLCLCLPHCLIGSLTRSLRMAFLSHNPLTQNTSNHISASTLSLEKLPDPWSWNQESACVPCCPEGAGRTWQVIPWAQMLLHCVNLEISSTICLMHFSHEGWSLALLSSYIGSLLFFCSNDSSGNILKYLKKNCPPNLTRYKSINE